MNPLEKKIKYVAIQNVYCISSLCLSTVPSGVLKSKSLSVGKGILQCVIDLNNCKVPCKYNCSGKMLYIDRFELWDQEADKLYNNQCALAFSINLYRAEHVLGCTGFPKSLFLLNQIFFWHFFGAFISRISCIFFLDSCLVHLTLSLLSLLNTNHNHIYRSMTPVGIEILNKTKYEFCLMIMC